MAAANSEQGMGEEVNRELVGVAHGPWRPR